MKVNVGYLILFVQLVIVFLSDFISRAIYFFSHTVQLAFSLLFILLLLIIYKKRANLNVVNFLLLALTILAIGIFRNQFFLNLLQLILVSSNFIFIFFLDKLTEVSLRKLIKLILIFSFLQLFFDLFFPKDVIDFMDTYSGSFIMANNKSRFLMFIYPYALFLPKRYYIYSGIGKTVFLVVVAYSIYIGYSNLAIAIFFLSIVIAFAIRNIYVVGLLYIVGLFILSSIVEYYALKDTNKRYTPLEMNYHRFFHKEHGVAAVYKYGFEKLKESNFIGVGFGNFSSRSGQIFDSEVTENIPKQLIKFWQPLFETKAPYGLSSLFVLIVELGFFALIPIFILLRWLNTIYQKSPYYLRVMVVFMFFIINYNPTFFEFNECVLYLLTIIIIYKLIPFEKSKPVHLAT
jgi:hypothetical protein